MGVRPPSSEDEDTTGSVEFGIADVERHVSDADLAFPATADEVVRSLGDPAVAYDPNGRTVRLSRVVERTEREEFESRQDLLNALHPVFEDLRTSRGGGVIGWVRSLIPGN